MRIFGDDAHDKDSELVLQSDTLLVGDSGWKPFDAAVHIEDNLIVLDVRLEGVDAGHGLYLIGIDVDQEGPDSTTQVIVDQAVVGQSERLPDVVVGRSFVF